MAQQTETAAEVRGESVGALLSRVTEDFNHLVRSHVELAKVEIKEEVARAGKGAGMLTGAAVAGLITLLLLSMAVAWGLAEVMPEGFAFLLVGVVWAAIAGVLALRGRTELKRVDPVPPQTKETIQEDVQWAKQQR